MNLLVTAGNTLAPIDRVRGITNVFTGRTGAAVARHAANRGHDVRLVTSHPATATDFPATVTPYTTFDDLAVILEAAVRSHAFDAIVHAAAVSDYRVAAAHATPDGPQLDPRTKLKSDLPELWLRLERTPKLVDQFREPWGFRGVLVKFKLEVGVTDDELLAVAERSRQQSRADLMVANRYETMAECAYLGAGDYERVIRADLPARLLAAIAATREGRPWRTS